VTSNGHPGAAINCGRLDWKTSTRQHWTHNGTFDHTFSNRNVRLSLRHSPAAQWLERSIDVIEMCSGNTVIRHRSCALPARRVIYLGIGTED